MISSERFYQKYKEMYKNNKLVLTNLSYMSFLQIFLLLYPLITYPYLIRVLGKELYGVVLTAQMLASYASLFIDFGSNYVCTKHVSICRDDKEKLSEILSNVLSVRFVIFVICFFVYLIIAVVVPTYRDYFWLFLLTYGFTTNELLFPQFFFQGLEKMKLISIISISTKLLMVALIFVLIKSKEDVLLVPVIYSIGFFVGGLISLYLIYCKLNIRIVRPSFKSSMFYVKDSSSIFATDLICAIKDRFSYFLVGSFVGMSEVVVYDLGLKLNGLISKPFTIICTVLFPRIALNRDLRFIKKTILFSFTTTILLVLLTNVFLEDIVMFFLHEKCDMLPLRLFMIAPIILSVSYVIANNFLVAFGFNKYIFYSIVITTSVYIISLIILFIYGHLDNIMSFICIALISIVTEFLYRVIVSNRLIKNNYAK